MIFRALSTRSLFCKYQCFSSLRRSPNSHLQDIKKGCDVKPQLSALNKNVTHNVTALYSTFTQMSLDNLWGSASAVSNAGKKRGRGKRGASKRVVNLYKGRIPGQVGSTVFSYPGFNTFIFAGNSKTKATTSDVDKDWMAKVFSDRDKRNRRFRFKRWPMERGWTGGKLPGMSIGPPEPVGEYTFDGFDSRVLEFKHVSHMTGNQGRKQSMSALVVTGNGRGLVGTAIGKASMGNTAMKKAKNTAGQKLSFIELKEDRTIFHPFHVQAGASHVFAEPKPPGYGIAAHRAIKTLCNSIGIKDIYCKVEGRTKNVQSITRAFLEGLRNQETHQVLADKMGLHVVELTDTYNVPRVLASPSKEQVKTDPEEHWDLKRHYYGGKTKLRKGKGHRFFEDFDSFHKYKFRMIKKRNQPGLQLQRKADALPVD